MPLNVELAKNVLKYRTKWQFPDLFNTQREERYSATSYFPLKESDESTFSYVGEEVDSPGQQSSFTTWSSFREENKK